MVPSFLEILGHRYSGHADTGSDTGRFIHLSEDKYGAAKITGAGSIRGDGGGMVLIFAESAPAELCAAYGYELLDVEGEARGVHDTDFSAG